VVRFTRSRGWVITSPQGGFKEVAWSRAMDAGSSATTQCAVVEGRFAFTQEVNVADGTWEEREVGDFTGAPTFHRPMAADWAYPPNSALVRDLYTQGGVDPGTVQAFPFAELLCLNVGCQREPLAVEQGMPGHIGTVLVVARGKDLEGGDLYLFADDGPSVVAATAEAHFLVFVPLRTRFCITKVTSGFLLMAQCPVIGRALRVPTTPAP